MNVWLWDAGRWCGVALERDGALRAAALCLEGGGAKTARVEPARVAMDLHFEPTYVRLGAGWTASRQSSGPLEWEPFGGMSVPGPARRIRTIPGKEHHAAL